MASRKERILEIKRVIEPMKRNTPDPFGYDVAELARRMQELCDILLELDAEIEEGKRAT